MDAVPFSKHAPSLAVDHIPALASLFKRLVPPPVEQLFQIGVPNDILVHLVQRLGLEHFLELACSERLPNLPYLKITVRRCDPIKYSKRLLQHSS